MRKYIATILFLLLIALASLIYFIKVNKSDLINNCKLIGEVSNDVHSVWNTTAACYGYIYVTIPLQEKYYTVTNSKNHMNIAEINSPKDIILADNKIYFKPVNLYYSSSSSKDTFWFDYFDGNETKTIKVSSLEQLPKYLVIDIQNGAITPYITYEQIPDTEKNYFSK